MLNFSLGIFLIFFTILERALYCDILGVCAELLRAGRVAAALTQWKRRI